jgi:hypothetical protein
MRSPAGTGFCVAIISFTLLMAAGVRVTGVVVVAGAPVTTSGVTAAVDIANLLVFLEIALSDNLFRHY